MNKTQKNKSISQEVLEKLVKKYTLTKGGSKKDLALRLWKLRHHMMTRKELDMIEDFLKIAPAKRYKGTQYKIKGRGKTERLVPC